MTTKHKIVRFRFDHAQFAEVLKELVDETSADMYAAMIGVHRGTLIKWRAGSYARDFSYPNMTNFILVCNLFDIDPRAFFVLSEEDE